MVWVTLYGAWSAVPRVVHLPLPVWAAKTTRLREPPSTSAVSSTVPVAPAAGAFSVTEGSAAWVVSVFAARSTMLDSAGTVTVIFLSAPLRTVPEPPYSVRKSMPADSVDSSTVFAAVPLFVATTYSLPRSGSVREKA